MKSKLNKMHNDLGFIAALDQSGGSTPHALELYGIQKDAYTNDEEMYTLIHQMRTRVIKSPAFDASKILGTILFEMTMDRKIDDMYTADYLWNVKGILPFLKVDKGLKDIENGVQLMKDMPDLDALLVKAKERNIFGTKMRSVIKEANTKGIEAIVKQQFAIGKIISDAGLIPILEPEVDIHISDKVEAEKILKNEIFKELEKMPASEQIIFKLTIPSVDNFYEDLIKHPSVVRVVALSGGYSQKEANDKLAKNHGLIASFSRALLVDLNASQSDKEFDDTLAKSIASIYKASIQ